MSGDPPVAISLKEWVRTARFGPVAPGMPFAVLREHFGEPDDVSVARTKYHEPSIWKYGDVEFYLDPDEGTLASILIHDFSVPSGGPRLRLDPWILRGGLPLDVLTSVLREAQIPYGEVPAVHYNPLLYIKTDPDLKLIFVSENQELWDRMRERVGPWRFFGVSHSVPR